MDAQHQGAAVSAAADSRGVGADEGEYMLTYGERGSKVVLVASEPITCSATHWVAVPRNSALVVARSKGGAVDVVQDPPGRRGRAPPPGGSAAVRPAPPRPVLPPHACPPHSCFCSCTRARVGITESLQRRSWSRAPSGSILSLTSPRWKFPIELYIYVPAPRTVPQVWECRHR